MNDEFKQKSLKLLADPNKLKDINYNPNKYDVLKHSIEYKFNYTITDIIYKQISKDIKIILTIDSILKDIINQITLSQIP